jgi:hypothetical protein
MRFFMCPIDISKSISIICLRTVCVYFVYVRHLFYGEWILNIEKWRLEVKGSCFYLVLFLKPHEKNRAKSTASFVSVYLLF